MFQVLQSSGAFARRLCLVLPAALLLWPAADAQAASRGRPWSVTVYVGPATTKWFGAVLSSGRFEANSVMLGVAADGRLLYLGEGISLAAEAEVTQYWFGHHNTTFALGLGFQASEPFGIKHTRLSIYDGPSYALDPPHVSIGYGGIIYPAYRQQLLNYVTLEYAVALSADSDWDGVVRMYHRSGAWGLYSIGDDDGLSVGLGLKYRF